MLATTSPTSGGAGITHVGCAPNVVSAPLQRRVGAGRGRRLPPAPIWRPPEDPVTG
jgi:hypothetical protein